jgi:hypothetical protein
MARFHVRDTFATHDKKTFVMAGFVIEGEVVHGMAISLPFKQNVMIKADIGRIEFIRRPDGNVVCLCVDCVSPEEVTLWNALNLRDKTVEIISSQPA